MLPGTGCSSLPETIELARFALEHGAAGILVAPPCVLPGRARRIGALLRGAARALPDQARVFLYNVPAYTGVPIDTADLRQSCGRVSVRASRV